MSRITRLAAAAFAAALSLAPALADRVILSPAPTALAADAARLDLEQSVGGSHANEAWANFGSPYTEIEVSEFHKPGVSAGALSLETQILPETSGLPSLALGVRDIGNNTSRYSATGYYGRGVYVVGGRTPIQLAAAPYPVRNLAYSVGLGVGGIKGPFGAVSADLPLRLRWTVEWDTRNFNERVALALAPFASIQYERQAAANFVGLALFTPITVF